MPDNTTRDTQSDSRVDHSAKVVHLEPDNQRILRSQLARLPAPVCAVHEKSKRLLLDLLKVYFDRADDSLFALADRAQSNVEQNLYFDSMREVRVQRRVIENRFSLSIDQAFAKLIVENERELSSDIDNTDTISADSLSLVSNTDLDEIVAVDSTVAKANKSFGESIQLLSLRLDSLVPVKVFQKNNPVGPDVICEAFMAQAKLLKIEVKAKLVLFKLFDRDVVNKLGPLYETANQILKEHNVLPSLSRTVQNPNRGGYSPGAGSRGNGNASNSSDSTSGGASYEQASPLDRTVMSALKSILGEGALGTTQFTSGDFSSQQGPYSEGPNQESGQLHQPSEQLLGLLTQAQHMPAVTSNNNVAVNVRALLAQMQQQTGDKASFGRVDDEVMNLVNLLFDFILEDRNLAVPMKALISRMQIPILKVAVADKSFFTKGGHVARRLLNEIATASIGWQGDNENCTSDPLYKKVDSIVRRLLEDYGTDVRIFQELLVDFTSFLEKEKKRAAVLERRIVDAEDGKAKAEIARKTVALEIEVRCQEIKLPEVVSHLIHDAWSNVLFVTALKYGYDSPDWLSALKTLDELISSVQAPETAAQRKKLIALVPNLLKKLRAGLDTISYNPFEMSDLFKSLEKIHLGCIRGNPSAKPAAKEPATTLGQAPNKTAPTKQSVAASLEKSSVDANSVSNSGSGVQSESVPKASKPNESSVTAPSSEAPTLPASDPHMEQVSRFVQGSWFEMKSADGESLRCRLATYIKPTGKFIFVNRNGMKVAERTQVDLALALKEGSLRVVDNSMLFDRALETVVTSLRKN